MANNLDGSREQFSSSKMQKMSYLIRCDSTGNEGRSGCTDPIQRHQRELVRKRKSGFSNDSKWTCRDMGEDFGDTEMSPSTSENEQKRELDMHNIEAKTVESFAMSSSEEEYLKEVALLQAQHRNPKGTLAGGAYKNKGLDRRQVDEVKSSSQFMMPKLERQNTDPAMKKAVNLEQERNSSLTQGAMSKPPRMPTLERQNTDPAMITTESSCTDPIVGNAKILQHSNSFRSDSLDVMPITIRRQDTDPVLFHQLKKGDSCAIFNDRCGQKRLDVGYKSGDSSDSDSLRMLPLTKQRTDPAASSEPLQEMVKSLENLMEPQLNATSSSASPSALHSEQFKKWLGNVESPDKNVIDLNVREDVSQGKCIDSYNCKCYVPVLNIGHKVVNQDILAGSPKRSITRNESISLSPVILDPRRSPLAADLVEYINQLRAETQDFAKNSSLSEHLVQALKGLRNVDSFSRKDLTGCRKEVVLESHGNEPVQPVQFSGAGPGISGLDAKTQSSRQQYPSPVQTSQEDGFLSDMLIPAKIKRSTSLPGSFSIPKADHNRELHRRKSLEPKSSRSLHGCAIVRSNSDAVLSKKNPRYEESPEPRFAERLPLSTWPRAPSSWSSESSDNSCTFQISTGSWSCCNGVKFCKLIVDLRRDKSTSSHPIELRLDAGDGLSSANIHCDKRGINPPFVLPKDHLFIRVEGVGQLELFASAYKQRWSSETARFSHLIDVGPKEKMKKVKMRDTPRTFWAYLGRRRHNGHAG